MAEGDLAGNALALFRQPEGTVGLLLHQARLLEDAHGLIDRGLRYLQTLGHLHGMNVRLLLKQLMDSLQIVFAGWG